MSACERVHCAGVIGRSAVLSILTWTLGVTTVAWKIRNVILDKYVNVSSLCCHHVSGDDFLEWLIRWSDGVDLR